MAGFGGIKKVKCAAAKPVFFAFVKSAFIPPHTAICFAASFCNITYFPFLSTRIVLRAMNVTRFRSFRVGARSIECFSFLSSRQKMLFF